MDTFYNNTLIIIPAYNEAARITKVIEEIHRDLPGAEILVVNDNSKDDTAQVARQSGAMVVSHPFNMGYSAGLLTGLVYAQSVNVDYAVFFDGDGQHIADEVIKLFQERDASHSDLVIGSRFMQKQDYHHGFFKSIGTNMFSGLIRLFARQRITDPTSGFQLLNRKAIQLYADMRGFPEYPDANLIIYMLRKGLKISETPVLMRSREDGVAMHSGFWKPIRYMILVIYSLMLAALFTRED